MFLHLIKIFSAIVLVLFQYSFLNFLPLGVATPNIILATLLVLVIDYGFEENLGWIIFLGILVDVMSFSSIGKNVVLFVMIAYLTSAVAKMFMVERKEGKLMLVFSVMMFSFLFYGFFDLIWSGGLSEGVKYFRGENVSILKSMLFYSLANTVLFYVASRVTEKVRKNILF